MRRSAFLLSLTLAVSVLHPSQARAATETLTLEPSGDTIFTLEGSYPRDPDVCPQKQRPPLRAKYRGRVQLSLSGGRVQMINTIGFELYLRGLAEVPTSWPEHALRAQAIAARSYALDAIRKERARAGDRGYDICATDQCQVYRGAAIELGAFGERWVAAISATRRQVMTYRGRLVQTFYFSTSDGRTRRSFPGGTPQPYYPSVSGEDSDAPLARWTVRVPFSDLTPILRAAGEWSGGTITSATATSSGVRLSDGSRTATLDRQTLMRALNRQAQCVFPTRYPTRGSQTGGKLPLTVPGTTFSVRTASTGITLNGRGWGHGVGMSQWGARSLAARGRTASQILSHFYGPARIATASPPRTIRVLAAEGVSSVRIAANGPFIARTSNGERVAGDRFEVRGGRTMKILRGVGPSLKPLLTVTPETDRFTATPGSPLSVGFTLSGAARVSASVLRNGQEVSTTDETSFTLGDQTMQLFAPAIGGTYEIVLRASDGIDDVRSRAMSLLVPVADPGGAPIQPNEGGNGVLWVIIAGLALALAAGGRLYVRRRRQPNVNV